MTSLTDIKEGLSDVWENIASGWTDLRDRAAGAITRFNPVHKTDETAQQRSLYNHTSRWGVLAAEVAETTDKIIVSIEAPGMNADDFDLAVIDNDLLVRGEKQFNSEYEHDRYHIMECAYGRFERIIPLPASIEDDKTTAKYKRGVLTVTLKKAKTAQARKIVIKS